MRNANNQEQEAGNVVFSKWVGGLSCVYIVCGWRHSCSYSGILTLYFSLESYSWGKFACFSLSEENTARYGMPHVGNRLGTEPRPYIMPPHGEWHGPALVIVWRPLLCLRTKSFYTVFCCQAVGSLNLSAWEELVTLSSTGVGNFRRSRGPVFA